MHADLRVDVDGHPATVRADGTHLRVRSDHPLPIARELRLAARQAGAGRTRPGRALGWAADQLATAGLTATVEGPSGPVLHLGGPGSRLGRWATGSRSVRPGSLGGLRPVLRAAAIAAVRSHRALAGGFAAAGVAAGVVTVVHRRRRRGW